MNMESCQDGPSHRASDPPLYLSSLSLRIFLPHLPDPEATTLWVFTLPYSPISFLPILGSILYSLIKCYPDCLLPTPLECPIIRLKRQ
jgi:hypothetical protein